MPSTAGILGQTCHASSASLRVTPHPCHASVSTSCRVCLCHAASEPHVFRLCEILIGSLTFNRYLLPITSYIPTGGLTKVCMISSLKERENTNRGYIKPTATPPCFRSAASATEPNRAWVKETPALHGSTPLQNQTEPTAWKHHMCPLCYLRCRTSTCHNMCFLFYFLS